MIGRHVPLTQALLDALQSVPPGSQPDPSTLHVAAVVPLQPFVPGEHTCVAHEAVLPLALVAQYWPEVQVM